MYANQIIDSLSKIDEKSFALSKFWIIDCLKSSIKFHLGEFTDSIDNLLVRMSGLPMFHGMFLPYQCTLLTYCESQEHTSTNEYAKSSKRGILAIQVDENSIRILQFAFYDGKQVWIIPLYGIDYHKDNQCKIVNVINEEEMFRRAGKLLTTHELRDYCKQIQSEASIFNAFLCLLDCKNISAETVHPPDRLNKSRTRKGKLPLYEYNVLNLVLPGTKQRSKSSAHATLENLHRVHLCRGHFKEYTTDRPLFGKHTGRYWWQPIVRGKGTGLIVKDYHVSLASPQYDDI